MSNKEFSAACDAFGAMHEERERARQERMAKDWNIAGDRVAAK